MAFNGLLRLPQKGRNFQLQSAPLADQARHGFLRYFGMLLLYAVWFLPACAGGSAKSLTPAAEEARQAYQSINLALAKDHRYIDYDTLMEVYREMRSSPAPIPRLEELLREMIDRRNADPRIDQMVLILAAHAMGNSQFPIPDVQALFEQILEQDAERISHWVLVFVAEAIGEYPIDLPGGDALVDRVQEWQARLDSEDHGEKEYFGTHFLPPPKSRTIQTHIARITEQRARQRERRAYYMLINGNISEDAIVAAFNFLDRHGVPGSGEIPRYPLVFMMENWHLLPDEIKQQQP
jgi:hypothetical protein